MGTVNQIVLIQETDDVVVHAFLSRIAGKPIQMISDVAVGVVVEENLCRLEAAFPGCKKQRGLLLKEAKGAVSTA